MKPLLHLLKRTILAAIFALLTGAPGVTAEMKNLSLGYSSIGPMAAGLWTAKAVGAFAKYGIDANLVFISSGPVLVQALIGGNVSGGLTGTSSLIAAVLGGAPLVAVAGTANRPTLRLWAQPEINRLDDLRGKTLGVSRFGSVSDDLTRILLRKNGLESAVTIRQFGGTTETGMAFKHRQIAGAVLANLRVDAPMRMLVDLAEAGIPYSMQAIVVPREFARRSPETVEAIVRAYTEGIAALHLQREKSLATIAQFGRLRDPKRIEEIYADAIKYLERVPRIEPDAVFTILDFMGKKRGSLDTFADNSIIDRLAQQGLIDQLYRKH